MKALKPTSGEQLSKVWRQDYQMPGNGAKKQYLRKTLYYSF